MQDIKTNYDKVAPELETYKIIQGDQLAISLFTMDEELSAFFAPYNVESERYIMGGQGSSRNGNFGNFGNSGGLGAGTGGDGGGRLGYSNRIFIVYPDGTINFPYIGRVYVLDMTLREIGKILSDRLSIYSEGTTVNVYLNNRYFSVLGELGAGRVMMRGTSMTIYQALSTATSVGMYGDRTKVSIIRQTKDGSIVKTFDLRTKDIIDSEYYYIQPNDVIYIPTSGKKFFGSVSTLTGMITYAATMAGIVVLAVRLF